MRAMEELADTTERHVLGGGFPAVPPDGAAVHRLDAVNLISLHDTRFHGISGLAKRLEDVVIGSIICSGISCPCC